MSCSIVSSMGSVSSQRTALRAAEPLPWPVHARACQRRLRCYAEPAKGGRPKKQAPETDVALPADVMADIEAAAAEMEAAKAAGGRPPEILEEFSNFTPDPPGHKSGFVAIIGRPNAGKSTLMNALLQQPLSIVTHKAQTTRHRILGILSDPGLQVVFLDTPGIVMDKRNMLEDKMMNAVQQAVKDSDCLLAIVDASHEAEQALAMIQPGEDWKGPPMAVLLNKADLLEPEELEALEGWYRLYCKADIVLPISALQSANLEAVVEWVASKLPEGPSMYPKDIVSELPERFFVSEIIRKHIFLQYMQEIPYTVAVEVTNYKERSKGKDLIEADIVVDKERLKPIMIGRGGSALKQVGTAARAEIEEFLGRPVFLDLSVKVREGWRKDAEQLERMGY